jgi:hypothetical protein
LSPCYEWDNTYTGSIDECASPPCDVDFSGDPVTIANTHYYNDTSYGSDYTYPHPLRGEGDTTPPTLSSATVNGTTLTLGFNEVVNATINTGFTVTPSGGAATLTYASGTGTAYLVYTVNRTIVNGETMTLDYTQPGNGIEDTSWNDLTNITGFTVTVNTAAAAVGTMGIGSGGSVGVGSGTGSIKVN